MKGFVCGLIFKQRQKAFFSPQWMWKVVIYLPSHNRSRSMNVVVYQKNILGLKISFIFSLRLLVSVLALDQVVRFEPWLGTVCCVIARHFTLIVTEPLSTQVYKWVQANLLLRVTL